MTTIRAALLEDAKAIADCHIAAWRDTYRPIVADEYLSRLSVETQTAKSVTNLQQPNCGTFVAQSVNGETIGFINGGPERTGRTDYRGEIYAIYILKVWRRQGVGRRLLQQFCAHLIQSGIANLIVWALEGNEYRHCYRAWGGDEIDSGPIKIGEQELIEIAYGWKDIRPLAVANEPE